MNIQNETNENNGNIPSDFSIANSNSNNQNNIDQNLLDQIFENQPDSQHKNETNININQSVNSNSQPQNEQPLIDFGPSIEILPNDISNQNTNQNQLNQEITNPTSEKIIDQEIDLPQNPYKTEVEPTIEGDTNIVDNYNGIFKKPNTSDSRRATIQSLPSKKKSFLSKSKQNQPESDSETFSILNPQSKPENQPNTEKTNQQPNNEPIRPIRKSLFQRLKENFTSVKEPDFSPINYTPPPPPPGNRYVLVLDLDETLIHCSPFPPHPSIQFFKISDTEYIFKRPFLDDFLTYALSRYEIFIYTFGERDYANEVLNQIAPSIDDAHRLCRECCILTDDGIVIKNLDILNRDRSHLIFVDDNDDALQSNDENLVVIPTWKGMPQDVALLGWLQPILELCRSSPDTRPVIKSVKNRKRRYTCS